MPSLRVLRQKTKSVKSTQQITRAMKMVAAARLNKAQEAILAARPFADKLESVLQGLAHLAKTSQNADDFIHPFLKPRTGKRIDVVLVTADRGLCGGFNAHLIRHTVRFLSQHHDDDVHLWAVGKKGRDFFKRHGAKIEKEYVNVFQRLRYSQAEILGKELIETFETTDTRAVYFIYNEFKSRLQQNLVDRIFLPIQEIPATQPTLDYLYEPNKKELLEELLPRYFKGQIYRILLESQSAELAARMNAMESATKNAGELIQSLTLTMNKIRQASITTEISEIVGGAEALQSD